MKFKNLLFSLALSFFGCQNPTPPISAPALQLEVYLRYLQSEQTYHAEAVFRKSEGNSTAPLPFEWTNEVKFDGKGMKTLQQVDKTYRVDFDGKHEAAHNIVWTNDQKQPQQAVFPLAFIDDFGFQPEKLSRSQPALLTWKGNPIAENESLLLFWEHPEHGVISMPITGATSKPELKIPAVKISELQPGNWQLYLVVKKAIKSADSQLEIKGLTEFYSKTKTFTVVNE